MRAGGVAGCTDVSDHLTPADLVPNLDGKARNVRVKGRDASAVAYRDIVSVGVVVGDLDDRSVVAGVDLGTVWRGDVDTVVELRLSGDRMRSPAKAAGDGRIL